MLQEYFMSGTKDTVTGSHVGLEIETDFIDQSSGLPISAAVANTLLAAATGRPARCVQQRELGRQKIELALGPCSSIEELLELAHRSLRWLYTAAATLGAIPVFEPEFTYGPSLLNITEPRDRLWLGLDGPAALEMLCRCSSVQFTVDVNPADAITVINRLWAASIHTLDYAPNDRNWQRYMATTKAGYRANRYGGPAGFADIADYVRQLSLHDVVMHHGRPTKLPPDTTPNLEIDLFLRSVWWHYRLRRYGNTLAVEIRPFARRDDSCLELYWSKLAPIFA